MHTLNILPASRTLSSDKSTLIFLWEHSPPRPHPPLSVHEDQVGLISPPKRHTIQVWPIRANIMDSGWARGPGLANGHHLRLLLEPLGKRLFSVGVVKLEGQDSWENSASEWNQHWGKPVWAPGCSHTWSQYHSDAAVYEPASSFVPMSF